MTQAPWPAVIVAGVLVLWIFSAKAVERQRRQPLSPAAWRACFEFDLSPAARRYREAFGASEEETALIEREFRRFFVLLAENPGLSFGLHNGAIDDFWHQLICCTALYQVFCAAVAGRFLHHDPQGGSGDGYARTWWAYFDRFCEVPAPLYWPTPDPAERPEPRREHTTLFDFSFSDGGSHGGCWGGDSGGDGGGHGCGGGDGGGCAGGCGGGD